MINWSLFAVLDAVRADLTTLHQVAIEIDRICEPRNHAYPSRSR